MNFFLFLSLSMIWPRFANAIPNTERQIYSKERARKILPPNRLKGKNTLTQAIVNKPNTTYVIRYDYVLGSDVTIPDNCVLEFDGGSIRNGSITGTNTIINYNSTIFDNVEIKGSWNVPVIHANMFSERGEGNFLPKLFKLCSENIANTVVIDEGTYNLYPKRAGYKIPIIYSNTTVDIKGTININSDNHDGGIGFVCSGKNIHIKGNGIIVGDRDYNNSDTEWSPTFFCNNCDSLVVEGITIEKSYGDGIYCRYNCNNVIVKGVTFKKIRRCAIAFNSGENNTVTQCTFIENGGRAPGCAIELENDGQDMDIPIVTFQIINNYFRKNDRDIVLGAGNTYTDTVVVKGNKSENSVSSFFSAPGLKSEYNIRNVIIENNSIDGCSMFVNACFKNKAIIRGNNVRTEKADEKIPCLNIKGVVLCENNTIYCPNRPAFENTYGGVYDSQFDIINNKITAHNSILEVKKSRIKGNTFDTSCLMLFLYDNSECKDNLINGTLTSGSLIYLGLSSSEFKSNSVDFNNTPNYGIKLVRKDGNSKIVNNTYRNIRSNAVISETRTK